MLNRMHLKLYNVKTQPAIAITVILALILLTFGIYVIIPPAWLGLVANAAYADQLVRSVFGIFMCVPAIPILYKNIKYDLRTYVTKKAHTDRPFLFWMGVTYFYLCALRIIAVGIFPPVWIAYIALGLISMVLWLACGR
jgi:hypothetical protein